MAMPMKFQYTKLGEARSKWYIGQLVDWVKKDNQYFSFSLRTMHGLRAFRMDRVVEAERGYVRDCLDAANQLAETVAKLEMQKIVQGE
jgi:hypothetical protein